VALTQEQIDFFFQNGYLAYGRILEDSQIECLRQEYDREFAQARQEGSYRNLSVPDDTDLQGKQQAPEQMLQIMQMCDRNIHFRRHLYDRRILDIVQDLIGPNIMLFHDQALYKPAHTGGPVYWHQDNAYWKCSPANLVSCWLTLDDVDKDNGAMQVLPGSHLRPLRPDPADSKGPLLDFGRDLDTSRAVVIPLPAGGCMFHHCQTLHYTGPNLTSRQRRAIVVHYMVPGTRGGDGQVLRVDFSRPLLCINMQ